MICPRCSVAEISPLTNACELCGFAPDGSVAVETPRADATDELVRRELAHQFHIDFLIGQGAASAVYLAREKDSDRLVILKVLPRLPEYGSDADSRFRSAVSVAQALDHAHLVPILRHGTTDSLFWYSMEPVRGRPLREVLRARGPMEPKTCLRICAQIASALDYAHRRAVVHGDLKPENVLIDHDGWARVCDALITRALQPKPKRITGPRPIPGSKPQGAPQSPGKAPARVSGPAARGSGGQVEAGASQASAAPRSAYIAPEDYAEGLRSAASDQYALAVLVYECLTGYPPGAGLPAGAPPAPLATLRPDLPPSVPFAVRRAMSERPTDRFPGVLDFVTMLESGAVPPADARPSSSNKGTQVLLLDADWEPAPSPPFRRRLRLVLAATVVAAVAWAGALIYQRMHQAQAERPTPSLPQPDAESTAAQPESLAAVATVAPAEATPAPAASPAPASRVARTPSRPSRPRRTARRPAATARANVAPSTEPASAVPAAAPSGHLFVNATPWGEVLVDGQSVGNTPKANIPLAAGAHEIRVVRDGYDPFRRTITVAAGETIRLTNIVLAERRP